MELRPYQREAVDAVYRHLRDRDDNPVVFIEHLAHYRIKGEIPEGDYTLPIGVADVKRSGKDVTVVATGLMVQRALNAAATLAQEGIELEVIDPRTISPLDSQAIIGSVEKTGRLVVVTGSLKPFGLGAEIAAQVAEKNPSMLKAPVKRITPPFTPSPFGQRFEEFLYPKEPAIIDAVHDMLR